MHKKKHILIIASLEQWRKDKLTSAWLWIPIEKAYVIPIAAELGKELILYNYETWFFFCSQGFSYHNAEERMAVLNQWLLPTKSQVPRFATYVLDFRILIIGFYILDIKVIA